MEYIGFLFFGVAGLSFFCLSNMFFQDHVHLLAPCWVFALRRCLSLEFQTKYTKL